VCVYLGAVSNFRAINNGIFALPYSCCVGKFKRTRFPGSTSSSNSHAAKYVSRNATTVSIIFLLFQNAFRCKSKRVSKNVFIACNIYIYRYVRMPVRFPEQRRNCIGFTIIALCTNRVDCDSPIFLSTTSWKISAGQPNVFN